ncbi:hypothetical protein GWI33_011211, partial [Rhynchophorus ferrugineus]
IQRPNNKIRTRRHSNPLTNAEHRVGTVQEETPPAVPENQLEAARRRLSGRSERRDSN